MGFLAEYDALATQAVPPQQVAQQQMGLFQKWLIGNPDALFEELRAHRPIFVTPGPIVVSRYRDVVEVMEYNQIFSVAPWGASMRRALGGPNFVLGMEDGAEYKREISILRLAVRREDADRAAAIAAQAAEKLAKEGERKGSFDITDGYARLIPTLFVGEYIGAPGPDPTTLMTWQRKIFVEIFFNLTHDPQIQEEARLAAAALNDYVQTLIDQAHADHAAGKPHADTVLGRLLSMQASPSSALSDERVRVNIAGCVAGVIDNACTGIVNAMDILLSRPDDLAGAVRAAQSDNDEELTRYVLEAMRFRVPAPLLFRMTLESYVLGKGTDHETTIPANKLIFVSTASAMVDASELTNPQAFDLHRPMTHYLHFGWSLHECLGKFLGLAVIVQAVKALLKLKNLRRADGPKGQPKYDPHHFPIAFSVTCDTPSEVVPNSETA